MKVFLIIPKFKHLIWVNIVDSKKKIQHPKAIFFDMGNTIFDFHQGASDEEKDRQGLILFTKKLQNYNSSITIKDTKFYFYNELIKILDLRKKRDKEFPVDTYLQPILSKFKLNLSIDQKISLLYNFFKPSIDSMYYHPDLPQMLEKISSNGIKIGIISNTYIYSRILKDICKNINIDYSITSYTFSIDTTYRKPHHEIFKIALQTLGVNAEDSVMIGDNIEADIIPAAHLGFYTIHLKRKKENLKNLPNSTWIIEKINEIMEIIEI